jgi:hypothetical protein
MASIYPYFANFSQSRICHDKPKNRGAGAEGLAPLVLGDLWAIVYFREILNFGLHPSEKLRKL